MTQWLTLASVTVLGALVITGLSGYILAQSKISQLSRDDSLISEVNIQLQLSEKLIVANQIENNNQSLLLQTVDRLTVSQEIILGYQNLSNETTSTLNSMAPPLRNMRSMLASSEPAIDLVAIERSSRQINSAALRLSASLKQEKVAHLNSYNNIIIGTLAACFVFVGCSLFLNLGPIRKRLLSSITQIESSQEAVTKRAKDLDTLKSKLENANSDLSQRHFTLMRAYDESTSVNDYLMLASARFEELFHGVPYACLSVDEHGVVYEWNSAASKLFGIPGHRIVQKSIFSKFLGSKNDETIKKLIHEAFEGNNVSNIEIVIPRKDDIRQLLVSVFPICGVEKRPSGVLIACANITEQKDAEHEALRANSKVESILESIQDAFVTLDNSLVYSYANSTAANLLKRNKDDIIGLKISDVAPSWNESGLVSLIRHSMESGNSRIFDHYFLDKEAWYEFRIYPSEEGVSVFYNNVTARKEAETLIREQQEQLEQAMEKSRDDAILLADQQAELEKVNEHLKTLATTDGLTGLLNHRALHDELSLAISRANRSNEPLSFALLDVDHFKSYNDRFGHLAGDEVLKAVSIVLLSSVRDIDVVARYGGEEFCVILPGANTETALIACERMREAIEQFNLSDQKVTVSIGVSEYNGEDAVSLISEADQALYSAKATGRNRVCLWEPPSSANCA